MKKSLNFLFFILSVCISSFSVSAFADDIPHTIGSILDRSSHTAIEPRYFNTSDLIHKINTVHSAGPRITAHVGPHKLVQQPKTLVNALQALTSSRKHNEFDAIKTPTTPCEDVVCAAENIFGHGIGSRLLILLMEHNYNGSHFGQAHSTGWTALQLDLVLAGLNDLPALTRNTSVRPMVIDTRLQRFLNQTASAHSAHSLLAISSKEDKVGIRLGDGWVGLDSAQKRSTIVHEVVHDIARTYENESNWKEKWHKASKKDAKAAGKRKVHISQYARLNHDEDIAESAVAYRYLPHRLKKMSPERYDFLREHIFDGKEYLQASSRNL